MGLAAALTGGATKTPKLPPPPLGFKGLFTSLRYLVRVSVRVRVRVRVKGER